jgi:formylglycine-generating enzyme required for sulfatase activity
MTALLLLAAQFVTIPAGSFTMGCSPRTDCPEHVEPSEVTFKQPFQLMKYEVTVGQFRAFVKTTGYKTHAETASQKRTWSNPRSYKVHDRQPVMYVTAKDAEAYCTSIGARLPTEDEWTYAFRAGGETIRGHLWWDTDGRYLWFRENSDYRPHAVGTRLANRWSLHDMEGNAWEWTTASRPGGSPYVIRGGSWITCRRIEGKPTDKPSPNDDPFSRCPSDGIVHVRDDIGFRCALDGRAP